METVNQNHQISYRRLIFSLGLVLALSLFVIPATIGKPYTFELFDLTEYFLLFVVPALAAFLLLMVAKNKVNDPDKFGGYCWAIFMASVVLLAIPMFISLFYWLDDESKNMGLIGMADFFFSSLVIGGWLFSIPLLIVSLALSVVGLRKYPMNEGISLPILSVAVHSMVLGLAYWFLEVIF